MRTGCSVKVYGPQASFGGSWCSKPVKVEVNGRSYCATHDPEAVKRRQQKQQERWDAETQQMQQRAAQAKEQQRRASCYDDLLATLQKIAEADDPYEPCGWAINAAKAAIKKATEA